MIIEELNSEKVVIFGSDFFEKHSDFLSEGNLKCSIKITSDFFYYVVISIVISL